MVRGHNEGHGRRLIKAFEALESFPALAASRDRVLEVVRDEHASTGEVIRAIESDVALVITVLRIANRMAGKKRGRIARGYYADIVVFDPGSISDSPPSGSRPAGKPVGIAHVLVNGVPAVQGGSYIPEVRAGQVLRR